MKLASKLSVENLTTSERNAIASPSISDLIFNITTSQYEYWDGSSWKPVVDYENIVNAPLGSVDLHSDVDTTTSTPVLGDSLVWNGIQWVPSSGTSGQTSNNYVFAHSSLFQKASSNNNFRSFAFNDMIIDGWQYNQSILSGTGTSVDPIIVQDAYFQCNSSGFFGGTLEVITKKSGGGNADIKIVASINGLEIPGTHNGMDITSNNTTFSVSRTFLFNITAGQILRASWATSSASNVTISLPPDGSIIVDPTSVVFTIRRLT